MKKTLIIWGTAVFLVVMAIFVTAQYNKNNQNIKDEQKNPKTGVQDETTAADTSSKQQAPNFTLSDLTGKKVSLKDYQGKNIFLNFWATWCPPCKKEMPDLEKVYQQYKNKDLVVLTVNIGEDKETVESFVKENGYHFNVLLDVTQSVAAQYNITSIPQSFFIDKNGNIVEKRIGAMDEAQMKEYIDMLYQ